MLIAMAGLPATGKSTLATHLAKELGGVVLSKDPVRVALFPPAVLDYSTAQGDLAMAAVYSAAAYLHKTAPQRSVIVDGRTFLRAYQVHDLLALATSLNESPRILKCVCADEIARDRLEQAVAQGGHPAGNRTYALYLALQARAEPIHVPHLVLDTGKMPLEECVARCLAYVEG
jgi:adenylylsulfate kinase